MNYADELFDEHYRSNNRNNDNGNRKWYEFYKVIPIEDLPEYAPKFIRGATNLSKIWLRKGMDYLERVKVLAHEISHIANPDERNEYKIDELSLAFVPVAHDILQRGDRKLTVGYKIS